MLKRVTMILAALGLTAGLLVAVLVFAHVRSASDVALAADPALAGMQQTGTDTTTGITVSGEGKVFVKPNVALVTIGVDITTASLTEATSQSNTRMAAVVAKIKGMGIADKDIQTASYNVNPITQQPKDNTSTPSITGYRVSNQMRITVRKIDDLGKILDAAVQAGANSVYGVSFTLDDMTPYQQQARAAAVKDALDKAGQLAKAANIQLGQVLSITEGTLQSSPVAPTAARMSLAAGAEVPVQTGEMQITVNVVARLSIK